MARKRLAHRLLEPRNQDSRNLIHASLAPDGISAARRVPRLTVDQELRESFAEKGDLVFEGVVDKRKLAGLREQIVTEFDRVKAAGELFTGGGAVSGHLNCLPGARSRFVYEALEAVGSLDIVRALSPTPLRAPNVGCNLNLLHSSQQNVHIDGLASHSWRHRA